MKITKNFTDFNMNDSIEISLNDRLLMKIDLIGKSDIEVTMPNTIILEVNKNRMGTMMMYQMCESFIKGEPSCNGFPDFREMNVVLSYMTREELTLLQNMLI